MCIKMKKKKSLGLFNILKGLMNLKKDMLLLMKKSQKKVAISQNKNSILHIRLIIIIRKTK